MRRYICMGPDNLRSLEWRWLLVVSVDTLFTEIRCFSHSKYNFLIMDSYSLIFVKCATYLSTDLNLS